MFFYEKSYIFYICTNINENTIYSIKLIVCHFFAILNYSFRLNNNIHFFNKIDNNFDVIIIVEKNVIIQIDNMFFSNINYFVNEKI